MNKYNQISLFAKYDSTQAAWVVGRFCLPIENNNDIMKLEPVCRPITTYIHIKGTVDTRKLEPNCKHLSRTT